MILLNILSGPQNVFYSCLFFYRIQEKNKPGLFPKITVQKKKYNYTVRSKRTTYRIFANWNVNSQWGDGKSSNCNESSEY